jgi:hypothetical protein
MMGSMGTSFSLECWSDRSDEPVGLGQIEADYLPRVGDRMVVCGRRVAGKKWHPVEFKVDQVYWELDLDADKQEATVTVLVVPDSAVMPALYCDCGPGEWLVEDGRCSSCGYLPLPEPK